MGKKSLERHRLRWQDDILKQWGERLRTGFIWLKTASSGGLL
jgi:hypothetical protein